MDQDRSLDVPYEYHAIPFVAFVAEEGQAYAFLGGSTIFPTGNATYGCGNAAVEPCPALKVGLEHAFKFVMQSTLLLCHLIHI